MSTRWRRNPFTFIYTKSATPCQAKLPACRSLTGSIPTAEISKKLKKPEPALVIIIYKLRFTNHESKTINVIHPNPLFAVFVELGCVYF